MDKIMGILFGLTVVAALTQPDHRSSKSAESKESRRWGAFKKWLVIDADESLNKKVSTNGRRSV
jgi:hypothetical protein